MDFLNVDILIKCNRKVMWTFLCVCIKKQKNEYNVLNSYVKYKVNEKEGKLKIFMMAIFLRYF